MHFTVVGDTQSSSSGVFICIVIIIVIWIFVYLFFWYKTSVKFHGTNETLGNVKMF